MKKLLSLALSFLMLCSVGASSALAENYPDMTTDDEVIEARFSDFMNVYATLYKTSLGFYHVEGGAGVDSYSKWVEVTVTIEACNSDGQYYPVDGFEWSASGNLAAATQATRDLLGGSYRAHTVAKCYQDGVLLETVEAYSDVVNVPY